jgi:ketosteroid isomerase-like protein
MNGNVDEVAEMFTPDGVLESPLVPPGHAFPNRMTGRAEIRRELAAHHARSTGGPIKVDVPRTRYVLHTTADPDVFIAEIDAAVDTDGEISIMSFVRIFRLRDGEIALLRDYFAPEHVD